MKSSGWRLAASDLRQTTEFLWMTLDDAECKEEGSIRRIRVEIEGIVQGVGFRPFVFRLARNHQLSGWVKNTPGGVLLEAEGEETGISAFLAGIETEAPPLPPSLP